MTVPTAAPTQMPEGSIALRRIDLRAGGPAAVGELDRLARRGVVPDRRVLDGARAIVDSVRAGGESAVRAANERFGGGSADGRLTLGSENLERAADALEPDVRVALEAAITNVRRVAEVQRPETTRIETVPGVEVERRWRPLERVGCYVPGGGAAYPSSLVMTVVPALVAGVDSIVVASPADALGRLDRVLLGAAGILGVETLLVAGGAQAIGALAFGLPSVGFGPVERIVGPGNAWVTAAKLALVGEVAIDVPAGPSEGCVIADAAAESRLVAADLVTQAEHGPDSPAILVTTDERLAADTPALVEAILATAPRAAVVREALRAHGAIVLVADLDAAIDVVNAYAPEHLSIHVADDELERVVEAARNAGSVFVGRWAPESAGDYATGANHVLPTGGLARSCEALSVEVFGRFTQVQRITRAGLATLRPTIETLAAVEGLDLHGRAVAARFEP